MIPAVRASKTGFFFLKNNFLFQFHLVCPGDGAVVHKSDVLITPKYKIILKVINNI